MPKIKELVQCKHPNSRKTNALLKQIKKEKSREKSKQTANIKLNLIGEKILWFRDNLEENCDLYNPQQTLDIIEKYLGRFTEELEQIKLKHSVGNRKNRQHANREDIILMTIKREREEFTTCGLEVPDLLNPSQLKIIKGWTGELRFLSNFKLKRYSKAYLEKRIKGDSKVKEEAEQATMDVF